MIKDAIMKKSNLYSLLTVCIFITAYSAKGDDFLTNLTPEQTIHGFRVANIYDNNDNQPMGGRFISEKYGFIVDLIQIQSVPQAFMWVKTIPTSSKGEPHACEHLLLGKGNKGRAVAGMEDMYLTESSAYTAQLRTCYHFNTKAGTDNFYKIFEAKLQALLHPDFTDEEIRREVCHIGVNANQDDGTLSLEEKGTVFTEMVSTFEKPWYYTYGTIDKMVYGEDHPLTYNSGGDPDVMRGMTAEDMWKFHKETYYLANMGTIIAISPDVPIDGFLKEMNRILLNSQKEIRPFTEPSITVYGLPPANKATPGSTRLSTFPSNNPEDPGYMFFSWPAEVKVDAAEQFFMDIFLSTFANGQTSNLYNLLINSETKKIDIGGSYVYASSDDYMEAAITFGIGGVTSNKINPELLEIVRGIIIDELKAVANYPADSEDLKKFNDKIRTSISESRRYYEDNLNSPPMFGARGGSAGSWVQLMQVLEKTDGFHKNLTLDGIIEFAESEIEKESNIWTGYIDRWKLLSTPPYLIGSTPDTTILPKMKSEREQRLVKYIEDFKGKYNQSDAQLAIAKYKEEFDNNTAALNALASNDKLPGFIDNPPMTLDDQLKYETIRVTDKIIMVASTFENISSSTFGIAFDMNVIPESLLVFLPMIPDFITSIGVIKKDEVIPYDKMDELLRKEVYSFSSYYATNAQNGRVELVITGKGNDLKELNSVIDWVETGLFNPYLSTENLSRINDIIGQSLISLRNRTKGSEEGWVNDPADAYRYQNNPLYLSTSCFLTETHHMLRLKYLLTPPGNETEQTGITSFIDNLNQQGKNKSRVELAELLDSEPSLSTLKSDKAKEISSDIVRSLKTTINDIPDENLSEDWDYLCNQIKEDLLTKPEDIITKINYIFGLIRVADVTRMHIISNSSNRTATLEKITEFANKLDHNKKSTKQNYNNIDNIVNQLKSRQPGLDKPVYAGLLHDGTSNGVLIFSAKLTDKYDLNKESALDGLAGKLYSGYGPHGLFMKTWAAGLAYSNGYRFNEQTGYARYYAERCPDVAETMRFVVNELKNAEKNPALSEYAIAQVFRNSRAPSKYEQRGVAMANDITDGFDPEKVQSYRKNILSMKNRDGLYEDLTSRMEKTYGSVMIGYGNKLSESSDGVFFLIGPEKQFQSLEKLIEQEEGSQPVYRLYPRDFWLRK